MDEIEAALHGLVGKVLTSATVEGAEDSAGGSHSRLTLGADDGTVVVLATQDSDGYQSWLRVVS